jgi:hypothetical protein
VITYATTAIRIIYYDLSITFQGSSRRHIAQRGVSHYSLKTKLLCCTCGELLTRKCPSRLAQATPHKIYSFRNSVPFMDIGNCVGTALTTAVGEHLYLRIARPAPCVERCGVLNFYASFYQSVSILTSATLWLVLFPGSCFSNLKVAST